MHKQTHKDRHIYKHKREKHVKITISKKNICDKYNNKLLFIYIQNPLTLPQNYYKPLK